MQSPIRRRTASLLLCLFAIVFSGCTDPSDNAFISANLLFPPAKTMGPDCTVSDSSDNTAIAIATGTYQPPAGAASPSIWGHLQCQYKNPDVLVTVRMQSDADAAKKQHEDFLQQMGEMSSLKDYDTSSMKRYGAGGATWKDPFAHGAYFRYGNLLVSLSGDSPQELQDVAAKLVSHNQSSP